MKKEKNLIQPGRTVWMRSLASMRYTHASMSVSRPK
jgi:hypothetical protein